MITPSLSQTVGAIVAFQPNIMADSSDELPSLSSMDWLPIIVSFAIKEKEVIWVVCDIVIGCQILCQDFFDTIIYNNLVAFSMLLLFDPKAALDTPLVVQEIANPQLQ
jgi:hypothetical protein